MINVVKGIVGAVLFFIVCVGGYKIYEYDGKSEYILYYGENELIKENDDVDIGDVVRGFESVRAKHTKAGIVSISGNQVFVERINDDTRISKEYCGIFYKDKPTKVSVCEIMIYNSWGNVFESYREGKVEDYRRKYFLTMLSVIDECLLVKCTVERDLFNWRGNFHYVSGDEIVSYKSYESEINAFVMLVKNGCLYNVDNNCDFRISEAMYSLYPESDFISYVEAVVAGMISFDTRNYERSSARLKEVSIDYFGGTDKISMFYGDGLYLWSSVKLKEDNKGKSSVTAKSLREKLLLQLLVTEELCEVWGSAHCNDEFKIILGSASSYANYILYPNACSDEDEDEDESEYPCKPYYENLYGHNASIVPLEN